MIIERLGQTKHEEQFVLSRRKHMDGSCIKAFSEFLYFPCITGMLKLKKRNSPFRNYKSKNRRFMHVLNGQYVVHGEDKQNIFSHSLFHCYVMKATSP